MKTFTTFFFLFQLAFFSNAQEKMTPSETGIFKKEIAQKAKTYQTIAGKFIQKKHLTFLANDIQSSGKFYFSAPDKIKWVYLEPFRYSVIFKNNKLYINDAGKKSGVDLSSSKLFDKLNAMIIGSINGKMLQSGDFKITCYRNPQEVRVHLIPTKPVVSKLFEKIMLAFHENLTIDRVKLLEPSGDYTLIFFKELKFNTPIDDSVFQQ